MLSFIFAGLTGICVVPTFADAYLRRDDLKRSANLFADFLHRSSVFVADALLFGKAMLYNVHRHIFRQDVFYAATAALPLMRSDGNRFFLLRRV